jgi:hypothetical protein
MLTTLKHRLCCLLCKLLDPAIALFHWEIMVNNSLRSANMTAKPLSSSAFHLSGGYPPETINEA